MYKVTNYGLQAIELNKQLRFSNEITSILKRINQYNSTANTYNLDVDFEKIQCLIKVGFIKKTISNHSDVKLDNQDNTDNKIYDIKQQLAGLIKESKSEKIWDILMNLETVFDKNGMIWLLNQIMDTTKDNNHYKYKQLFDQLLELDNE